MQAKTLYINFDGALCDILPTWVDAYNVAANDDLMVEDITDYPWYPHTKGWTLNQVEALRYQPHFYLEAKPVKGVATAVYTLMRAGLTLKAVTVDDSALFGAKLQWMEFWCGGLNLELMCIPRVCNYHKVWQDGLLVDTTTLFYPDILLSTLYNTHDEPSTYGRRVAWWGSLQMEILQGHIDL